MDVRWAGRLAACVETRVNRHDVEAFPIVDSGTGQGRRTGDQHCQSRQVRFRRTTNAGVGAAYLLKLARLASTALEFRKYLGGETRINEYCHNLAISGGTAAARILGTDIMENEKGELTANMVSQRGGGGGGRCNAGTIGQDG